MVRYAEHGGTLGSWMAKLTADLDAYYTLMEFTYAWYSREPKRHREWWGERWKRWSELKKRRGW